MFEPFDDVDMIAEVKGSDFLFGHIRVRQCWREKMSDHFEVVKKAIEFRKPDYLPMETIDVPGIYNAYHTLDPETVTFIPGAENSDSFWVCCYSWVHEIIRKTPAGESIKRDQFGTLLKTPNDTNATYTILKNPLAHKDSLEGFEFPDPDDTDPSFEKLGAVIKDKYPDRFINGTIDAGIFLTSMMLIGEEEFLIKTFDNIHFVLELYEKVMEYYKSLVLKYKKAGAHMITEFEDIGGTSSLLINPQVWKKYFKPIVKEFFKFVHEQGLYTGILIDGNCAEILDDLLDMEIDVFQSCDMYTTGIKTIKDKLGGKMCIKASVDMQKTLPLGTPEEVKKDACELVETFHDSNGGFICEVVRWFRPSYPDMNVLASVDAFNEYRREIL